ncbi:MAG: hypothetical protein U1E39_17365 [Planctomycetota bacterium]
MVEDIPVAGTPLDPGLFSGKRRSPRRRRTLIVDIGEPGGTHYEARTVDVSRGGMLLEFVDDKLKAPSDPAELVGFATRLMMMFPTGMETTFGSGAVKTHAVVVRLVSSASAASPILLGCRFDTPLTDVDCRLLGLDLDGDETESEPAERATPEEGFDDLMGFLKDASRSWDFDLDDDDAPSATTTLSDDDLAHVGRRAAASRPSLGTPMSPPWAEPGEVVTHLFPTDAPVFGPRYRGRLVHAEPNLALVDLPLPPHEQDPFGWAAGLGARVRLVALCEGRVLWEAIATVTRFDVAPDEQVRASLTPDREPSAALLESLRGVAHAR